MDLLPALLRLAEPSTAWRQGVVESAGTVTEAAVRLLAECLDGPVPEHVVPPMWWMPDPAPWVPLSALSPDGHPVGGLGFPPLADRRRLFAGGRVEVRAPVPVGTALRRVTRVVDARAVRTGSGPMLFATVEHRHLRSDGDLVATAEEDIAYRSGALVGRSAAGPIAPLDPAPGPRLRLVPDELRLFRFSALTGNSHRIHYDQAYAEGVEGLAGLLVHGPLLALLLLELPRREAPGVAVRAFEYRLRRPVVSGSEVVAEVVGREAGRWQVRAVVEGAVVATGAVTLG